MKTAKQMERHFKGISNHNRINILLEVDKSGSMSLEQITNSVKGDVQNISQHTRRLVNAGLLNKVYKGRFVIHTLSPYGKEMVKFIKNFREK